MRASRVYEPRHTIAPKPRPIAVVLDETAAFSLLISQTKRGNGTAVILLAALFGHDPLDTGHAA